MAAAGVGVLLAACAPAAPTDLNSAQAMMDLADAINALREENALLGAELDSLRVVVARQDTLLRRLANATGVPVTRP